ncbi:DUF2325 domain-containing protein [Azohydromonas aeria]|uniref:DUF2325 domain-containing protein n=1 Tax=Azohydromonas aeria TaxID=2590212 RepID=UPI0012FB82E0|nr:DUF2325 domain-containing protein [Azohydromonas aeria]
MCERDQQSQGVAVLKPAGALSVAGISGSRRKRLWELGATAFCPVIGVCLPIAALRSLVEKVLRAPAPASDYELHCCTINECKQRTPVAERLHKELDARYALAVRQAAACKSTEALAQWWALQRRAGDQLPGALWAVLTHPRCDTPCADAVLADVHMLQHQVGAAQRVDLARHAELQAQHAALQRESALLQERCAQALTDKRALIERQAAELVRLRAELIGRDTVIAGLCEQFKALEASVPGLRTRVEQAAQITAQLARIQTLERQASHWQQRAAELQQWRQAQEERLAQGTAAGTPPAPGAEADIEAAQLLREKSVLCVGGRSGSVPIYRRLIERTGGRFLHHDGGEEDSSAQLDVNLAAADLVICQTGCISHDAYWRVKDHCKRHGKQCVFVEKPSAASLARELRAIRVVPAARDAAGPVRVESALER